MAYKDCSCPICKDRAHGAKRVACQTGCEKYLSWRLSEQELRRKERESRPYYSEARQKFIRRHQLKQKGGRRI